jgi:hypothetical protein
MTLVPDIIKFLIFNCFSPYNRTMMALFESLTTHSGYHFPLLPSPEAHDFHHKKYDFVHLDAETYISKHEF